MVVADNPDAALRRAHELHRAGRSKEAASCLVAAIRERPTSLAPYRLLADVQRSLGRSTAEAAVLEELVSLEPLNAENWTRLASLHAECGRSEDSYWAYLQGSRLSPSESANWQGLCSSALSTQRFARAEEAKEQLLERFPDRAGSHLFAGHIHKAQGNSEQARAAYQRALTLEGNSSEAIFNLVDLAVPAANDPLTLRVEKLLASGNLADTDSANLNFALARILEAARHYDSSFAYYEQANAAVVRVMDAKGIRYRPAEIEAWVTRSVATYPSTAFRRPLEPLPIGLRLIFIVGMPRSGTSMIEQILSSHPRVAGGGELTIATDCELFYTQRRKEWGLGGAVDPENERERDLLTEVRERYVDKLFERNLDAEFVTDKLPGNFARLGFIRTLFPDAIIVHCKRHPIATCWSLFTSNFALHDPYYNSLEHLPHYYGCYQRLMTHWRSVLSPAVTDIRYEELVSNPEREIRHLLDQAALNWDDRCMNFHRSSRPVLTASHTQVRSPIYNTSLERWRPFESRLGALSGLIGE
jgi:cytochrome c-type biogenesis protein CcmH/NrfG